MQTMYQNWNIFDVIQYTFINVLNVNVSKHFFQYFVHIYINYICTMYLYISNCNYQIIKYKTWIKEIREKQI